MDEGLTTNREGAVEFEEEEVMALESLRLVCERMVVTGRVLERASGRRRWRLMDVRGEGKGGRKVGRGKERRPKPKETRQREEREGRRLCQIGHRGGRWGGGTDLLV
jgi:hypothetical protein